MNKHISRPWSVLYIIDLCIAREFDHADAELLTYLIQQFGNQLVKSGHVDIGLDKPVCDTIAYAVAKCVEVYFALN